MWCDARALRLDCCSRLSVVTCREVRAGEELCISYGPLARRHRQRQLRRQLLQQQYFFECHCMACAVDADVAVGARAVPSRQPTPASADTSPRPTPAAPAEATTTSANDGEPVGNTMVADEGSAVGCVPATQARLVVHEGAVCMAHRGNRLEAVPAVSPPEADSGSQEAYASLRCAECGLMSADDVATLLGVLQLADQYRQRAEALYEGSEGDSQHEASLEDKSKVGWVVSSRC